MNYQPSTSLRPRLAAKFLGIAESTFWRWAKERPGFPQAIKLGPRTTVYPLDKLAAWRDAQANKAAESTKEEAAGMLATPTTAQGLEETEGIASVPAPKSTRQEKIERSWIAALASSGHAAYRVEGGALLVTRGGMVKHIPDLRSLIEFARHVGARV